MDWSVFGILISLAFIVILALRGWHIIILAPLAVVIVCIFSSMNIMEGLTGPYMKGFVNYAGRFYLIFLAGSVFGKFMEDSQAARSIADGILKVIGKEVPLRMLLSIALVAICLTYGGVSLFVVIFAIIPIARPLFKELNLPWHIFMAPFVFGAASLTMTMLPGTPAIQNIMPTKYMASTPTSAPLVGLAGAVIVIIFNVLYFRYILKKAKAEGEVYEDPAPGVFDRDEGHLPSLACLDRDRSVLAYSLNRVLEEIDEDAFHLVLVHGNRLEALFTPPFEADVPVAKLRAE